MAIPRAESSSDSVAVHDRNFKPSGDQHSATATSERFREDLVTIFGRPQSLDSTKMDKAESGTRSDASDNSPDKINNKILTDFAKTNGLDIKTNPDGKQEYSLKYNGEKITIGTVENTRDGFREINKSLKEFTRVKEAELESKYGIKFAHPGDPKPRQMPEENSKRAGKELEVRDPKLREVLGIEAALEKANPSHASMERGKPLTFYFLKDQSYAPKYKGTAAFDNNVNGSPAVIVDPNSLDRAPITEKDRTDTAKRPHESIESLFIHELGHHTEDKVLNSAKDKAAVYKQMGWEKIPGSPGGQNDWMIKGKDGRGYIPGSGDPTEPWERIDHRGRVTKVPSDRVARLAQVKPATDYFEGPHEMLAEGLTMLRLGDNHRAQLQNKDKRLYRTMKEVDQKEIDQTHGKGKFIRSYEGKLVPRNADTEKALREREEKEKITSH